MGFLTFDIIDRQCVFFNNLAAELFELRDQETAPELQLDSIFATENRGDFKAFNEDLIAHEGLYQDVVLRKTNGHVFVANVGVKRLKIENQSLLLLMVQDVTLQKKLQREIVAKQIEIKGAFEELIKQNKQLKELDLAKNKFIALTSHELRTPLAAMIASAEILHMKLYDSPEQMTEFVDMIYEQGQNLHELVNDILDFAKIQAGRMDFYIEEHNPVKGLIDLVEGFKSMAETSHVTISFTPPQLPVKCYYDELRLRQVLSNIINNAIKYNREGGTVTLWVEDAGDVLKILVKDTGNGIAPDQLEKVFNEFETLGQVAAHHKGTGLGMPISRRLMEGMGGKLLLSSEVGVGSLFWVEIPKTKVMAQELYRPRPGMSSDLVA